MKAILSTIVGGPETLQLGEVPVPIPGPLEVRITVKACSINYPDVLTIQDRYQVKLPRPFTPGHDVAGIISAIGEKVTDFQVGERVLATCHQGGLAQEAIAGESKCVAITDQLPFDLAAALPTTYGTSHYALHDRAHLRSGETLLVLGAAGGVGLAAVELGHAAGARVIAAASSQAKVDIAMKQGAAAGLVYPTGNLDKAQAKRLADDFKTACGPAGANVIYDAVGGAYTEAALRAIAFEGRLLIVGFPAGIAQIPMNLPLLKGCQIVGVFMGGAMERDPTIFRSTMRATIALHEQGRLQPYISERYPLAQAGRAIARLAAREATGKVVVTID